MNNIKSFKIPFLYKSNDILRGNDTFHLFFTLNKIKSVCFVPLCFIAIKTDEAGRLAETVVAGRAQLLASVQLLASEGPDLCAPWPVRL